MNFKKKDQMSTEKSALIDFIWAARPDSVRCKTLYGVSGTRQT